MKKGILFIVILASVIGFNTPSNAQSTVSGTSVGAVIISPIVLTQVTPLDFGAMAVVTGHSGVCIISTSGVRTSTGGVNLSSLGVNPTNASFAVAGQANTTYDVTIPNMIMVTEILDGSETMTINSLLVRTASTSSDGYIGTLDGSGNDNFTIGGTLNIQASQSPGTYSGVFDVTVVYN